MTRLPHERPVIAFLEFDCRGDGQVCGDVLGSGVLEKVHEFSEYHEHAQVSEKSKTAMHSVRPIAPTSVGVWKQNLGRIKAQQMIHGSLTPDLIECGYESSAAWEELLEGVEPDTTRSLYPEKLYFWRRISQTLDARRKVARYRRMRRKSQ